MTTLLNVKDTHPTKDFTSITQRGLKALNLALLYAAEIAPRLPGTTEALSKDLDALGVVVPGAVQARNEAIAATAAQNVLVEQGYARVQAVRETVRRSRVKKDIRRAYGVGQKVAPTRVRDVKAALQQIVDRATGAPEEAATFGLIATDVEALTIMVESLTDTDMTQEKKRAKAPLSTKERNLTGNRILQAVTLIAGAGRFVFADDPLVHASFEALVANPKKPAGSRPKKTKAEPAKADPAKADPAKADPAKADPAKADPAKADPAKADPAKADSTKAPERSASASPDAIAEMSVA